MAADDGDADQDSDDSAKGSDSESASSFGVEDEDSVDKAPKRRKGAPATEAKPKERSRSVAPGGSAKPPKDQKDQKDQKEPKPAEPKPPKESKAQKAKQERANKLLAAAQKAYSSLEEVSLDMIWRSVIRANEIDRRANKCVQCQADLAAIMNDGFLTDNKEAVELRDGLLEYKDTTLEIRDLCRDIKAASGKDLEKAILQGSQMTKSFLSNMYGLFPDEKATLFEMLCSLARKLYTATLTALSGF